MLGARCRANRAASPNAFRADTDAGLQVTLVDQSSFARSQVALKEAAIAFNELRHGINEITSLHRPAELRQDSRNERRSVTCFRRAGRGRN